MNKQELIDILENLECSTESLSYDNGYEQGVYDSLSHVILLDEPKKVVVPRSVAEMIETYREKEINLAYLMRYFKGWHNKVNKGTMDSKALSWIVNNLEEFLDAWIHGYEVETEQLYYVKFDILYLQKYLVKNVETDQFYLSNNEKVVGNYEQVRFTEQEIKSIDERYWPFAVKVDGEQMKYKTKYSSIVPKGQIGECIDKLDGELLALLIKFGNGEVFWFMKRDLIEVEDK